MSAAQTLKKKWNSLSNQDKRLVRLYQQLSLDDIDERMYRFGRKRNIANNEKNKANFTHHAELYALAYGLKKQGVPLTGGAKTRKSKRRQTRRRRV